MTCYVCSHCQSLPSALFKISIENTSVYVLVGSFIMSSLAEEVMHCLSWATFSFSLCNYYCDLCIYFITKYTQHWNILVEYPFTYQKRVILVSLRYIKFSIWIIIYGYHWGFYVHMSNTITVKIRTFFFHIFIQRFHYLLSIYQAYHFPHYWYFCEWYWYW